MHACASPHEPVWAHVRDALARRVPQAPVPKGTGPAWGREAPEGWREGLQLPPAPPAAPRSCIIDKDELKDGLRVLIPMDDKLLYAGHVQTVHSPDM